MAVAISPEQSSHFGTSALRRSHSAPKIGTKQTASFRPSSSSSASRISEIHDRAIAVFSDSTPSSPPPSPRTIIADSTELTSSPKIEAGIPLNPGYRHLNLDPAQPPADQFSLPQYHQDVAFYTQEIEDLDAPPSPRGLGDSYTVSNNTSTVTSRPDTPDVCFEHAEDDTAVRAQPSRHVDYLSHDWKEEDIWESWKFIISRRGEYTNSARLENASWRTWMKSKYKLQTVSPEKLNWLKDCDVTWLYGPLQTGSNNLTESQPANSVELTKSNSFLLNKKPILKKRSMSEIMLQKSLSSSSLVKQAAAAVQAQQKEGGGRMARPRMERAATDYVTFPFSSRRISLTNSSLAASSSSSGAVSPPVERKHIHFNEKVEQCIAVEVKGDDDDDADADRYVFSDSDDDAIMMKRTTSTKRRRPIIRRRSSGSNNSESKTIAMLPSTKLKYQDSPEPPQPGSAMRHSYRSPVISPSSSQETLRPSKPSGKMFFAADDDDDDDDDDGDDQSDEESDDGLSFSSRRSAPPKAAEVLSKPASGGLKKSTSTGNLATEPAGMRRTESGMFMPYEEGEPAAANGGIVGKVIETVNTARDIAHVIWNVGWRR